MTETKIHPDESELAEFLGGGLAGEELARVEEHVAACGGCLETVVSARESVELFREKAFPRITIGTIMKKINPYLAIAVLSFALSFAFPQYFAQFLVATMLLGIKWVADSKSAKMLVMIYEAWKKGGDKEASRILKALDRQPKSRL
jgi:hypothetical protein